MDFKTAQDYLLLQAGRQPAVQEEVFLDRLQRGQPPIPGQVTSILLALKVILEGLRQAEYLDRELACALHLLAYESRQFYTAGLRANVIWPPLLNEDLERIAQLVKQIFLNT